MSRGTREANNREEGVCMKKMTIRVLMITVLITIIGVAHAADFDLGSTSGKVDWISLSGQKLLYMKEVLELNPVNSSDRLPTSGDLFLRTITTANRATLSLSATSADVDPSADIAMDNPWLLNGTTRQTIRVGDTHPVNYQVPTIASRGTGTYNIKVANVSSVGKFHILRVLNASAIDLRYSFANGSNALSMATMQGGLQTQSHTVTYKGLLESSTKIRIALANAGIKNYTLGSDVANISGVTRWIGDPSIGKYTPASGDNSLPSAFGSDWLIDPFAGQQTFAATLTDSNNETLRYVFYWDPTNTFKRGAFSLPLAGGISVTSLTDINAIVSKDFGRSINYVTPTVGLGTIFTPLLMPESWRAYTTQGVKGLSLDVQHTPKSDDTGTQKSIGLLALEVSFRVDASDLALTTSADLVQQKINTAIKNGASYADAVITQLRPTKYISVGNGVDLVKSVQQAGYNLSDFFQVKDNSNGGLFDATITFRVVVADQSGTPVQVGKGYFLIRDGAEDGYFRDPIIITTDASSNNGGGNNTQPSGDSSSSGCNTGLTSICVLAMIPSLFLRRRS